MGARLVVSIEKGGIEICNVYFHWSANTLDAYREMQKLTDIIETSEKTDPVLAIIYGLAKNGGGLTPEDEEFAKRRWPDEDIPIAKNRNEGLVAVSAEQIAYSERWAEGTSTIYLDNHTCINQLYNYYDSWQEMKLVYQLNDYDWQKDWDEAHFSNFSMVKWLGKPVPWAHLDDAISEIDDSLEYRNESGNLFFFEEC
ncbi:hypothetical protein [Faecalibaculum rodentium]|uniref:Uncharacterized protein n=2 Tax=Faecalibaculum rodentium TaxID=1702221 RepID=A0A1Q9YHH1_9FIRM|nr:hypothetical protein [Faecalibaculum rodentium]OLU43601.1 hypothetical protein BO223_11560 [Faecalibaculum rodentium]